MRGEGGGGCTDFCSAKINVSGLEMCLEGHKFDIELAIHMAAYVHTDIITNV